MKTKNPRQVLSDVLFEFNAIQREFKKKLFFLASSGNNIEQKDVLFEFDTKKQVLSDALVEFYAIEQKLKSCWLNPPSSHAKEQAGDGIEECKAIIQKLQGLHSSVDTKRCEVIIGELFELHSSVSRLEGAIHSMRLQDVIK